MRKRGNRRGEPDQTQAALALRVQWLLAVVTVDLLVLIALQPTLRLSADAIRTAYSLFAAVCALNLLTFGFYFRRWC